MPSQSSRNTFVGEKTGREMATYLQVVKRVEEWRARGERERERDASASQKAIGREWWRVTHCAFSWKCQRMRTPFARKMASPFVAFIGIAVAVLDGHGAVQHEHIFVERRRLPII